MSRARLGLKMFAAGLLLLQAACSAEDSEPPEADAAMNDLLPFCAEARGALLELSTMTSGRKPVDTSTLGAGAGQLRLLADRVSASEEVKADINVWRGALSTWSDKRTAMQPIFENGRLIEPDTSELDGALLKELSPPARRLADWVAAACDD